MSELQMGCIDNGFIVLAYSEHCKPLTLHTLMLQLVQTDRQHGRYSKDQHLFALFRISDINFQNSQKVGHAHLLSGLPMKVD